MTNYLRTENPHFLIDLVTIGQARTNNQFADIVKNIGIPLMRNKRNEYFSVNPNEYSGFNVEILKAVKQIYKMLHDGEIACELYPWCDGTVGINLTSDICLKQPWKRCALQELCSVALLLKNWNLHKHAFVHK